MTDRLTRANVIRELAPDMTSGADLGIDLGVIGNCCIGALIDRHAQIVWCCLPRLDGDPVFLAKNEFYLGYTRERAEGINFTSVKDVKKKA